MLSDERAIEIATIMAEQAKYTFVYQSSIAIAYPESSVLNDRLGLSIDKRILKHFNRLTGDAVVWEPSSYYWRPRLPEDIPGRNQGYAAKTKYYAKLYASYADKNKDK